MTADFSFVEGICQLRLCQVEYPRGMETDTCSPAQRLREWSDTCALQL